MLISRDTYRQVRGIFDPEAQAPLAVKGKVEPVQTYVVLQAKPRAFRMGTRGVEGIETHMVGREAELLALQAAYADAVGGETRLALVVGEAGVGKSRLLYEFETWVDLRPEEVYFFKGRAAPGLQNVPYSILRDLFAYRFEMLETDNAATALTKFRAGMGEFLPAERADLVGHLVGFDFSASPAVRNLAGSSELGQLGLVYLTQYLRAVAAREPVVLFLEDLHWADDSSLDQVERLLAALPAARLLVVGLTRPILFERRSHWSEGLAAVTRLELKPLSKQASLNLVDEILQKVDVIPEVLRELVVEGAEGNPFYLEELVKMLLDERVIERRDAAGEHWSVNLDRLKQTRIPPTLTGILQARLDGLPKPEREALQRAAVVGRMFWDAAVADLTETERAQVDGVLDAIRSRELIYWRERSAFAGTEEFLFKHALLRDAAYETVLLKLRKVYHAQVARWLEAHAGERIEEYAGLIAEHLERAGQTEAAARYLCRSAERARTAGAYRDVLEIARRALALLPEGSPEWPGAQFLYGRALYSLGDLGAARQALELALGAAQTADDDGLCVQSLDSLGTIAGESGDFALGRTYQERGLALARQTGNQAGTARTLIGLGSIDTRQGAYREAEGKLTEGRALYEALGDRCGLAMALDRLAVVAYLGLGDYPRALALDQQALALFQEIGARGLVASVLGNLGEIFRSMGDYVQAQRYYRESMAISSEVGDKYLAVVLTNNLGHTAAALGEDDQARAYYHEALPLAHELGMLPFLLDSLVGLAGILARSGQVEPALGLLGLAANHPALFDEVRLLIEQPLELLRTQCSPEQVEAGLARGKEMQLETVVADLLLLK